MRISTESGCSSGMIPELHERRLHGVVQHERGEAHGTDDEVCLAHALCTHGSQRTAVSAPRGLHARSAGQSVTTPASPAVRDRAQAVPLHGQVLVPAVDGEPARRRRLDDPRASPCPGAPRRPGHRARSASASKRAYPVGVEGVAEQRDLGAGKRRARRPRPPAVLRPRQHELGRAGRVARPRPPRPRLPGPWSRSPPGARASRAVPSASASVGTPRRASRASRHHRTGTGTCCTRSSRGSCNSTAVPSRLRRASTSTTSAPSAAARAIPSRLFSRASRSGVCGSADDERHGSGASRTIAATARYAASAGPSSSGRIRFAMIRSTHSMSGAAAHPDPGELAHHRGVADRVHERAGHLEVEAVHLVEPLRVGLRARARRRWRARGRRRRPPAGRSRTRARCPRR